MKKILFLLFLSVGVQAQHISSTRVFSGRFVRAYETEYQAYLDKGNALSYTLPSLGQRIKQNTLCNCIKVNVGSLTTNFDGIYILATDGSSDFATLNLVAPASYQAGKTNSPTFTTNQGFAGDGATSYLTTNYAWGTNGSAYTQNSAHRSFYMYAVSGSGMPSDGTTTATLNRMVIAGSGTNAINSNTTGITAVNFQSIGFKLINRTSSSNVFTYNKSSKQTFSSTSSATNNTVTQLLLRSGSNFSTNTISFYSWGKSLTDSQVTNLNICVTNYILGL